MFREIHETTAEYLRREAEDEERRRRNRMIAEMADTRMDIYDARHSAEAMASETEFILDPDKLIGA